MIPTPAPSPLIVQMIGSDTGSQWWTPLLPGIFILSGALAGALITFLSTWRSDSRKAKHEDARRWHADLQGAFADLIAKARQIYLNAGEFDDDPVETRKGERIAQLEEQLELSQRMMSLVTDIGPLTELVTILAPPTLVNATIRVQFASVHAAGIRNENRTAKMTELDASITALILEVREYFGADGISRKVERPVI